MFNRLKSKARAKTKADWLVIGITGLVSLLLLGKLIHLGWRIFGPAPRVGVQVERLDYQEGLAWAVSFFGAEPAGTVSAQPAVTTDIKVFGIISGGDESKAYVLLLIDGQRRDLFGVGDEITPGLTVFDITKDAVILRNATGEKTIPILEKTSENQLIVGNSSAEGENNTAAPASGSSSGLIILGDATRSGRKQNEQTTAVSPQPLSQSLPQPSPMNTAKPVTPTQVPAQPSQQVPQTAEQPRTQAPQQAPGAERSKPAQSSEKPVNGRTENRGTNPKPSSFPYYHTNEDQWG